MPAPAGDSDRVRMVTPLAPNADASRPSSGSVSSSRKAVGEAVTRPPVSSETISTSSSPRGSNRTWARMLMAAFSVCAP